MEMKVDAQKIIQRRQKNAWSQQHLSDISGLSLRTIQRIENTQAASQDSVKALAAAFGVTPADLFEDEIPVTDQATAMMRFGEKKIIYIGLISIVLLSILYWSQSVVANNQQSVMEPAQTSVTLDKTGIDDAMHWLSLVDKQNYIQSWQESHTLFQQQVTDQMWQDALVKVRTPLGLGRVEPCCINFVLNKRVLIKK